MSDVVKQLIEQMKKAESNCMHSEDAGDCIEAEKAGEWADELARIDREVIEPMAKEASQESDHLNMILENTRALPTDIRERLTNIRDNLEAAAKKYWGQP